ALVARLADVDPIAVGRNGPTVLAPLSFALFYEAGSALFRSTWGGIGVVIAQVSLNGIAAGHGGSFTSLALPATVSRKLFGPGLSPLRCRPRSRSPGSGRSWKRPRSTTPPGRRSAGPSRSIRAS